MRQTLTTAHWSAFGAFTGSLEQGKHSCLAPGPAETTATIRISTCSSSQRIRRQNPGWRTRAREPGRFKRP